MTFYPRLWNGALAAALLVASVTAAQQPNATPRGTFLFTRESRTSRRSRARRPRPASPSRVLGLAYTLYRADRGGVPIRVDPQQVLFTGDRIRLVVEPNIDGFLYVFATDDDAAATMIYPDDRLASGGNSVAAHVPYQIPSADEPRPDRQWFVVSGKPTTEHLYIVIAREPIEGIPTGKNLTAYCRAYPGACPWQPPDAVWDALLENASGGTLLTSRSNTFGQRQSAVEREAVARKIGLREDAPEPSVIQMNRSLETGVLVTRIDIAHR